MLKDYLAAAKNILFPKICFYCGKKISQGCLCEKCQEKITFLYPPLCPYCCRPISEDTSGPCKECVNEPHPYQRIISTTAYQEPMISLIHLFKYRNYDYLADFFASLMIEHLSKIGFKANSYHWIIPVPIHRHKLKERGYNQTELLAKLLSNYFKIPLINDIIIVTQTRPSQTTLQKDKRQKNVEGIFRVKKEIKNKRIILVDDIFTTGATTRASCQALKEKGADIITVITLSKTL